ncbi:hypothetical protein LC593_16825 [Nostoc sp. CHAB 5844]|nr:hypothetical protein [Nostoc sp. CHAB 5844]
MLLSQLIGSILHDLTAAQDYANKYSSELSRKYKKYEDTDENELSNYPVPVGRVQQIEFDLKFAIDSLETQKTIDIDKTHSNCDKIAEISVESAIERFEQVITQELKVTPVSTQPTTPASNTLPALDQPQQPQESSLNKQKENNRKSWLSTLENISRSNFIEYLETKVSQGLYDYVNNKYYDSKTEFIEIAWLREIIAEELLDGFMEHEDIQDLITETEELYNWEEGTIKKRIKEVLESVANDDVTDKDIRELISLTDERHTNIIVNPSTLKELQMGMISSMKIKAELDNYRWLITKAEQSLEKVHE